MSIVYYKNTFNQFEKFLQNFRKILLQCHYPHITEYFNDIAKILCNIWLEYFYLTFLEYWWKQKNFRSFEKYFWIFSSKFSIFKNFLSISEDCRWNIAVEQLFIK